MGCRTSSFMHLGKAYEPYYNCYNQGLGQTKESCRDHLEFKLLGWCTSSTRTWSQTFLVVTANFSCNVKIFLSALVVVTLMLLRVKLQFQTVEVFGFFCSVLA